MGGGGTINSLIDAPSKITELRSKLKKVAIKDYNEVGQSLPEIPNSNQNYLDIPINLNLDFIPKILYCDVELYSNYDSKYNAKVNLASNMGRVPVLYYSAQTAMSSELQLVAVDNRSAYIRIFKSPNTTKQTIKLLKTIAIE